MAYWAAIRHARKLDSQNRCQNIPCSSQIPKGFAYCWRCALLGGRRKIR